MTFTPSTHPLWALESDKYFAGFRLSRTELPKNTVLIDTKRNEIYPGFNAIPLSCLYPDWMMSDKESLAQDCATIIILYGKHSSHFVTLWEQVDWENEALLYRIQSGSLQFKRVDRYPISGDGFWIGLKR
jgi:hypothetical protein